MKISDDIELRCGDYREVLADVVADAFVTDAPYSDRTHAAAASVTKRDPSTMTMAPPRGIGYARWTEDDVRQCVAFIAPRCAGWVCSITDHVLARDWERELDSCGYYTFSPIACLEPGSRVRLAGDGPAQWSCWLVPARPRTGHYTKWGSLPGGYVFTENRSNRPVVGGKSIPLMRAIVRDYTRPGDLVCDPCAGGGTTAIACRMEGRRFIGAEIDPDTHAKAVRRIQGRAWKQTGQVDIWDHLDRGNK